jgi:hypothetical protein
MNAQKGALSISTQLEGCSSPEESCQTTRQRRSLLRHYNQTEIYYFLQLACALNMGQSKHGMWRVSMANYQPFLHTSSDGRVAGELPINPVINMDTNYNRLAVDKSFC